MSIGYERKAYVESDSVKKAQAALQTQQAVKPADYSSKWQGQIDDTLGKLMNRPEFKYDINEDALYQQAAQRYIQQGKQAMMDTMGQAAALTGGYGNSYAQNVGQQTYQGYLQGLNDQMPEFYQMALNRYIMEGDALKDQYSLLTNQENADYGRYRDTMSDWNTELDRLYQQWMNERSYDYGMYSDEQAYNQWLHEFLENQRRWDLQWAAANTEISTGGGNDESGYNGRTPGRGDDDDENDFGTSTLSTPMGEVSKLTEGLSSSDANKIITAARQDKKITKDQYKALKYLKE